MPGELSRPSVGVVGCGQWGRNHLRVWSELGCLRAACDPDPAQRLFVAELYPDIRVTHDPHEVIASSDIDAIVVAAPAPLHTQLALAAIDAGKHVLIEKPMATTLRDAYRIAAAAEAADCVAMVGHVLEYHPAVIALRKMVEEGELGRIRYVYSHRLNFGRVRTEEDALWSFAPHDLAILFSLVGAEPTSVSCHGGCYLGQGVADVTLMNLEFPGNVRSHIFVSWLHPFKEQRLVVVGEDKMVVFDDTTAWDRKLMVYPHAVKWMQGGIPVAAQAEGSPVSLQPAEALTEECLHFLGCISGGSHPRTDLHSGIRVMRTLDAGSRSMAAQGAPVTIALAEDAGYTAHPTAVVDDGAQIGRGSKIWHFSHVSGTAVVGASVTLGQGVYLGERTVLGDRVKVQNNVSVFEGVELEDDVFCGPAVTFTNVINPRAAVDRKAEFRPTRVRCGASLGANATIVCGVDIGRYAMVGAGAVVTRDVPAYALVVGSPARQIGWRCECGEALRPVGGERFSCAACALGYSVGEGGLRPDV